VHGPRFSRVFPSSLPIRVSSSSHRPCPLANHRTRDQPPPRLSPYHFPTSPSPSPSPFHPISIAIIQNSIVNPSAALIFPSASPDPLSPSPPSFPLPLRLNHSLPSAPSRPPETQSGLRLRRIVGPCPCGALRTGATRPWPASASCSSSSNPSLLPSMSAPKPTMASVRVPPRVPSFHRMAFYETVDRKFDPRIESSLKPQNRR
jgi:hypothetical protein